MLLNLLSIRQKVPRAHEGFPPKYAGIFGAGFVMSAIIYKIALEFTYFSVIGTRYAYQGFSIVDRGLLDVIINWGLYLSLVVLIAVLLSQRKISGVLFHVMFFLSAAPCLAYFSVSGKPVLYQVLVFFYWGLTALFLRIFKSVSFPSVRKVPREIVPAIPVLLLTVLLSALMKIRYNGFHVQLELFDVYDLRGAAEGAFPPTVRYLINWSSLAFTVFGVVFAYQKRYHLVLLLFAAQWVLFSIDGMKSYLLSLPAALIAYAAFKKFNFSVLGLGLSAVLLVGASLVIFFENPIVDFVFGYRIVFLPAFITGNFLEFFMVNSPDYLHQSILGRLGFVSQYSDPIPYLIDAYYGDGTASANTGLLGDAVANFGLFGVIIYPIFMAAYLRAADIVSDGLDIPILSGIVVVLGNALLNLAFFTFLLTGGGLFALFLVSVLRGYLVGAHHRRRMKCGIGSF